MSHSETETIAIAIAMSNNYPLIEYVVFCRTNFFEVESYFPLIMTQTAYSICIDCCVRSLKSFSELYHLERCLSQHEVCVVVSHACYECVLCRKNEQRATNTKFGIGKRQSK
jgi:hypothetical protein